MIKQGAQLKLYANKAKKFQKNHFLNYFRDKIIEVKLYIQFMCSLIKKIG